MQMKRHRIDYLRVFVPLCFCVSLFSSVATDSDDNRHARDIYRELIEINTASWFGS